MADCSYEMRPFRQHNSVYAGAGRTDSPQPLYQVSPMCIRSLLPFSLVAAMLCGHALWGQTADPRLAPVDVSVRDYVVDIHQVDLSSQANSVDILPQTTWKKLPVASTWGPQAISVASTQGTVSSTYSFGKHANTPMRTGTADRVLNTPAPGSAPKGARDSATGISALSLGRIPVRKTALPYIPNTNPENRSGEGDTSKKQHNWEVRDRQHAGLLKSSGRSHHQPSRFRSEPCLPQVASKQAPCGATSSKLRLSAADRLRQSASATRVR